MKKTWALLFAPILLMTGMAFASDGVIVVIDGKLVKADKVVSPKVTLTGAENTIAPGEIVVVEAKVEDDYPTYVKKRTYEWNVTESGYVKRTWNQGSQVMFGSGMKSTKVTVECKASFSYMVGTEEIVVTIPKQVDVTIGNPVPNPPDPPNPPNPPNPTPTPTLTGAAKFAYDTAIASGPANKATSALLVSTSFKEIAAQIGHDPELNEPEKLLARTKQSNNDALTKGGLNPDDWKPFSQALKKYLWDEYQAGHLKTVDDYKKVWEDISTGLAAVK